MKFSMRVISLCLTLMLVFGLVSVPASAENGSILYGIGFVNATGLNLRQQPDTGSAVLATANSRECVVILAQEGDWYHVIYNLQDGYMSAEFLTVSTVENAELGYGKVIGASVNLRSGPDTSYPKIGTATMDERCYILGLNQGWFKILHGNDICYIRSDFMNLTEIPYENRSSSNSPRFFRGGVSLGTAPSAAAVGSAAPVSTPAVSTVNTYSYSGNVTGSMIVAKAQEYLGTPYVYGGATPAGFDCSGFVYYVLGTFGLSPARTPAAQIEMGIPVDKANLQPGDVVFFAGTGGSGISHTGIYAGGGQFIHSPNSRSTVSYSDLTSGYWSEHYYAARRVV